jgi:hypothetical protein
MRSRAMGFQPYVETGFPHGPDQFISSAATSWAVIGSRTRCEIPKDRAAICGGPISSSRAATICIGVGLRETESTPTFLSEGLVTAA